MVEIKNYCKSIKSRPILNNVSYNFEYGKIYGIYGHNGSGKTMLLRAIAGLLVPDSGSVVIDGKVLHKDMSFPPSIGIVIENMNLLPQYNAFDNLKILGKIKKTATDEDIKTALERDGHTVETRTSGTQLTDTLCRWADCILLDVMMPGEDGFAVCRRIRAETDAPILFLTARTDEPSVLTGLGLGADDYLTKPFRVAELRARVAAHLRRQNRTPSHKITRGGVTLDLSAKEAGVGGTPLHLTKSEYAICELLALHAGQTFSKEQIYEAVFGYDGTADDTAITQHIKNIRAKLRVAGAGEVLQTIWGVGYQWKNEN